MRVVSLVPSITETLLAWEVQLVACTRFCEQPDLIHVGGTKDPDLDAIIRLAPDLVVMDEEENRRQDADDLRAARVAVHATAVRSLADVAPTLASLAIAVGAATPVAPPVPVAMPALRRAFVPIWKRPWMTVSGATYGSTLLAAAGVGNVFGDHPDRYPTLEADEIATAGADLVIAPDEPYPFGERHRAQLQVFAADVRFIDGKDLTWWGVRTHAALDRLRSLA